LLVELGYLGYENGETTITASGRLLAGVYAESALLVAESLREGLWTDLEPAELAAVVSALVYESRRPDGGGALPESETVRAGIDRTEQLWRGVRSAEERHRLPVGRQPDAGFADALYRWALGAPLDEALLCAGDAQGRPL